MNYSAVDTLWLATTAVPLIDDWIRKIGVHLYNGMLLSVEKKAKDLPLIAKRKKLEGVMPIKVSQKEKDKLDNITFVYNTRI